MLPLFGSRKLLCDGIPRRDLLQIGGLGAFSLSLAEATRLSAATTKAAPVRGGMKFGRAKSCILLFPFGSPPQHETFDPKPDAPREIQGEMGAISTAVPGVQIGEGLPQIARVADRMTIVRSMTHPYPVHGVAYALTGMPTYTPALEANPRAPEHWPFLGSAVNYVDRNRSPERIPAVPQNIGLPWRFGSKSTVPTLAGPYAAFLGEAHDPVWTDFTGSGTKVVPKLTDGQVADVRDPFAGITRDGRFRIADGGELPPELSLERIGLRRALISQFDHARVWLQDDRRVAAFDEHRRMAWSLLATSKVRDALDLDREPVAVRERFGLTLFGQSCLAARRLVEAGTRFVSVFWDPFEPFGGSCWDTHANHFPRLKEYLLPVFDMAYSALLLDLEQRGLLDETLVVCVSEHGRTPQIDSKPKGAGRHHWSRVYSAALAGGGAGAGTVVGRSDSQGGDVADTPVSPKDVLATTLHLLGIDAETTVPDRLGRELPIAGAGRVRPELLGA
ncbi:MAG: DUF1501 domain-containing protein [Planctomycetales bacterium]|nr:DUF1501 domain-containing protein [Planctomycetales bacterium]MBN8624785.1 DUF1501 domain-containing protein [Planctomycetota bacterium]